MAYTYLLLCSTIESACDLISEIGKYIEHDDVLAEKIFASIEDYTTNLFKKDLKIMHTKLRAFRKSIDKNTFAEGLAYCLAETLYNYLGFLVEV